MTRREGDAPQTYSLRRVQAMLGLSRRIVTGLIEQGFVAPARGPRQELRFSFQDLMLLRTAHALQKAQITPRRILQSLARLKAELPAEVPLSGLRIAAHGADVAVRSRDGHWQAASGQLLLDFDVAPAADGAVAIFERAAPGAPVAPVPEPPAEAPFQRGTALEARAPLEAEAAYREALRLEPRHVGALLNLGAMLAEAGRHAELVALTRAAQAAGVLDAADAQQAALVHFNHGVALDHLEHGAEAIAAYEMALLNDPALADAHYNLGRLCEQQGDARAALRHFAAYRRLQR